MKINLILFALSCGYLSYTVSAPITPKIIGGKIARADQWPWMAGLIYKNLSVSEGLFCGASLIAKDWVLTAAHCMINERSTTIDVLINRAQLDSNRGERLSVQQIIIHPDFNSVTFENDVALVKLATSSVETPIKLLSPDTFQDNAGKFALALGWGTLSATEDQFPLDLYQVELPLISNAHCIASMGNGIADGMLCAGDGLGTKDTCQGDSGGPLIVFDNESNSWRQAGITSWGFGCAEPNNYGVYTRIKKVALFISDHICAANEISEPTDLALIIEGNIVSANWRKLDNVSGYRLNYALFPQAKTLYSIDMNQLTQLSVELNLGDAFYVAMTSYTGNCLSDYSNVESFTIN